MNLFQDFIDIDLERLFCLLLDHLAWFATSLSASCWFFSYSHFKFFLLISETLACFYTESIFITQIPTKAKDAKVTTLDKICSFVRSLKGPHGRMICPSFIILVSYGFLKFIE